MIRIGEHKLQDVDLKWWRSQIGLVEQEPFLFDETIFERMRWRREDRGIEEARKQEVRGEIL